MKRKIEVLTAAALLLSVSSVAGDKLGEHNIIIEPIKPFPVRRWTIQTCNGVTFHEITFQQVNNGSINVVKDTDTGKPCCNKNVKSSARAGVQPRDSDACSPGTPESEGGTETNPGTLASAANLGGGFSGPSPDARPYGSTPRQTAPTGNTAYVPTLPFLEFALPPLTFGSTEPTLTSQCNTQLNPTGYQVNHNVATVTRLNLCTGATIDTVNVAQNPLELAVTPDGKYAIVTSFFNAITFIDTDNDSVSNVIQTDPNTFPYGIAISPDGSYALVTNFGAQNLVIVDVPTQSISGTIPLDQQSPQSVFFNPDGTLIWVTYPSQGIVEVIDVITGAVVASISASEPLDVAFNATGTVAYIANGGQPGSVMVINTTTYAVTANIATPSGTDDLLLSPDGAYLTTNNYFDGSISVIDTTALANVLTVPVTAAPFGATLVPIQ